MDLGFENSIKSKTNEELIDIYITPNSYQPEFVSLVFNEINKRNLPVDVINKIKGEKQKVEISNLAVGKQGSPLYIAVCFCLALFGGIPAIISGYIYGFSKHKGPDGNSYFVYNEGTRKLGYGILGTGIIMTLIELQLR